MPAEVGETAEAVPVVGPGAPGPGVAVVPVEQVVVGAAVALPTTRQRSQHTYRGRSY